MINYREFIEIQSDKRFGSPCIKGTRVSVYDVLNWLASGMTKLEIIEDYPELDEVKVNACLFYAADRSHYYAVA